MKPKSVFLCVSYPQPQAGKRQQELQLWLLLLVPHLGNFTCSKIYTFQWMSYKIHYKRADCSHHVHSRRTPTLPLRCKCTRTSESRCCYMPSRATMSASLLMARQVLASPTPWWADRKWRVNKGSFPWYGFDHINLSSKNSRQNSVIFVSFPALWGSFHKDKWNRRQQHVLLCRGKPSFSWTNETFWYHDCQMLWIRTGELHGNLLWTCAWFTEP